MIKILQIITLSEIGGAQKVLFHIVNSLNQKESFEFHAACAPGGELVEWLQKLGVKVYELPELVRAVSPRSDLAALIKLRRIMRENKYDLVHCHSSKAGIIGRFAAKWAGVPRIVFTVHGWGVTDLQSGPERIFFRWAEWLAGKAATDIVCVSKADYQLGKRFVRPDKMTVIYNGVESFGKPSGRLREIIGAGKDEILVGMVARLKGPKDPLFFIETARVLKDRGISNVRFVLIGDGPLKETCCEAIRRYKLGSCVHLLGTRTDLEEIYPDLDVFALFSSWEGLPLTICEAMMAGLPVVASRVGGVEEQVRDGWNGFLLDRPDVDAAADDLSKLILDESMRKQMGENSRKRAEDLFRVDRMAEEYEELYRKSR